MTDASVEARDLARTFHALVEAREAGMSAAILQAAPDGVGVYGRAGFEAYGRVVEYKPGPEEPPPTA